MKSNFGYLKKSFLLVIIIVSITLFSCSEDVNLKSDFKEDYAVYCIINIDSSYQTAIVTRSYDVEGFDAMSNNVDPSIDNAQIMLNSKQNEFTFSDSSITRTNNIRYNSPQKFYYLNNFQKEKSNHFNLSVLLPNGKQLTSEINIPNYSLYIYEDSLNLPIDLNSPGITIKWNLNNAGEGFYFLPRVLIFYYNKNETPQILHIKEIPVDYIQQNNQNIPVYPNVTYLDYIFYPQKIVNKALLNIAEDGERSNIIISHGIFELNVLEENLAMYYSSIKTYNNSYSIKVYEPVITNIKGGYGVFGAYFRKEIPVTFYKKFFTDLGYEFAEKDIK